MRALSSLIALLVTFAFGSCMQPRREPPDIDGDGDGDIDGDGDGDVDIDGDGDGDMDIDGDGDGDVDIDGDGDGDGDPCEMIECDDGDDCTFDWCDHGACLSEVLDADYDGFGDAECGGDDCDDHDAFVNPSQAESCGNRVDDDCDGLVDWDDDCMDGDDCESAFALSVPGEHWGSLTGLSNDARGSCGGDGPDAVYRIELVELSSVRAATEGTELDTVLYLRADGCEPDREVACDDDGGLHPTSRLDLAELEPGAYYLFVDLWSEVSVTPGLDYVVRVEWAAVGCGNGFIESGEECDDGNREEDDFCTERCEATGDYALGFDGTSDSVVVGPARELGLADELTAEVWFRQDVRADGQRRVLLRKGWSSSVNYALWVWDDGQLLGGIYVDGAPTTVMSEDAVDDGEWHHAALTFDGTTLALFLDGARVANEAGLRGEVAVDDSPLFVGCHSGGRTEWYFRGAIDEVRISSTARYGAAGFVPEARLTAAADTVALWHFDEGGGGVAVDSGPGRLRAMVNGCDWEPR